VRFTTLNSSTRMTALQAGQIDVLPRTTTWTQSRDTANGLNFSDPPSNCVPTVTPAIPHLARSAPIPQANGGSLASLFRSAEMPSLRGSPIA